MEVRDLRGGRSGYLVNVQFDFSPETSATVRSAMNIEGHSARKDCATANEDPLTYT
jgi:hypothetical protein